MKLTGFLLCTCVLFPVLNVFAIDYLTKEDMAYCEENYSQYKYLGDNAFLEREHRTLEARVCVHLYNDVVWKYSGSDRPDRLLARASYYVDLEFAKSTSSAKTGKITQEDQPITDLQKAGAKILELEKKVSDLEKKIEQKDAVIMEQLKVIMDLANKIKSTIFDQILLPNLKL